MVRLPDQHIVGACGSCSDCHAFSYDGPPHESKLISILDYNNAPTMEEAEEVRQAAAKITPTSAKVHDHPLSVLEIITRVDAELHPRSPTPPLKGAGWPSGQARPPLLRNIDCGWKIEPLNPQEVATAQANRSGYIPGQAIEVKFPIADVSRRLRVTIEILPN